jgi:hypothetical protein
MPYTKDQAAALSVVYCAPGLEPFKALQLSEAGTDGLTFEKELVYEGSFVKKNDKGEVEVAFTVDEPSLQHWHNTNSEMLSNGMHVYMPTLHTDDPEKNRAELKGTRLGINAKGKKALYGRVKFADAEAAKLAANSDVSIFVPPNVHDGLGREYKRAIKHVAFTSTPVIPGLEKFQAIAASFDFGNTGGTDMSSALLPVAQQLGIQAADQMDDAQLTQAIVAQFNALKGAQQPNPMNSAAPVAPQQQTLAPPSNGVNPNNPTMPMVAPAAPQLQPPQHKLHPALAASFNTLLKENRTVKLDALVMGGHISKATRDKLEAQYCSDATLALSMDDANFSKQFDGLLDALKDNKAITLGEQTAAQTLALSQGKQTTKNEVMRSAEKKREEFTEYQKQVAGGR